jgi:DNA-directed RNA polymerase subunit omega
VFGTTPHPEGITNPPIDRLLAEVGDSKYALVLSSSRRARQINAYYSQLQEGLLEHVGPLVEPTAQEKPLSIALRELDEGLLSVRASDVPGESAVAAAPAVDEPVAAEPAPAAPIDFDAPAPDALGTETPEA